LGEQQDVVNGDAYRNIPAHFEYTRHRLAVDDSLVGMSRNRRHIVSQKYPVVPRGPRKKRLVVKSCQAGILRADDVDAGISAEQSAKDIVIEILVREPAQDYPCQRASNRSRTPSGAHFDSFDALVSQMSR